LRLILQAGIKPASVEVKVTDDLGYRVDILLRPGLAMEVDGYAYHHSPEQMSEDARRRNRLLVSGTRVLVYTWRDITHDGHRVIAELRHALAQVDGSATAAT
jgi:very-short-patch-repair endonuclease